MRYFKREIDGKVEIRHFNRDVECVRAVNDGFEEIDIDKYLASKTGTIQNVVEDNSQPATTVKPASKKRGKRK